MLMLKNNRSYVKKKPDEWLTFVRFGWKTSVIEQIRLMVASMLIIPLMCWFPSLGMDRPRLIFNLGISRWHDQGKAARRSSTAQASKSPEKPQRVPFPLKRLKWKFIFHLRSCIVSNLLSMGVFDPTCALLTWYNNDPIKRWTLTVDHNPWRGRCTLCTQCVHQHV